MTAHKHAENMRLYAQDAAKTDRPWERWEYSDTATLNQHGEEIRDDWFDCRDNPDWHPNVKYRRKPQVIRVGRHEFPKPLTEAPEEGTDYFYIRVGDTCFEASSDNWIGSAYDLMRLESRRVHSTREAAQSHANVLNAICRGDVE